MCHSPRLVLCILLTAGQLIGISAARADGALALGGDVGLGGLGGTAYSTVQTGVEVVEGGLTLSLFGRVRLLLDGGGERGYVRRRDWDEVSDYVHILRLLRYRRAFGELDLDVRVGEVLGHTLGHGTLLRDYSNVADPDHPHAGVRIDVTHPRWGAAVLVDNFIAPSLVATRLSGQPVAGLSGLLTGTTVVFDVHAPTRVLLDEAGRRRIDRTFRLITDEAVVSLLGVDVEYSIGSSTAVLIPYMDFNGALYGEQDRIGGAGWHAGLRARLSLAEGDLVLAAQAEYNVSSSGYAPAYVQTFYDLERYQAGLTFSRAARADATRRGTRLAAMAGGPGGHGLLAQVGTQLGRRLRAKIGYSREPGPDAHRLWVRGGVTPINRLNLATMVALRGLGEELGGAAIAEVRLRITGPLYALAQYSRLWAVDEQSRFYGVIQGFNVALGGRWSDGH